MKLAKEMKRHVEVILKTLDILDCFQSRPVLTLKEIIEITGMTRSRAMRLTGTLMSRGYLHFEEESRHFCLGPRVMALGKAFETHNTLVSISRPFLRDLVSSTGELASLYVIDGLERIALAREKGTYEISYNVSEGQRMELYAGAAGKLLLAFAALDILEKIAAKGFMKKLTPVTISDPENLFKELEAVRRMGYAVSKGERASDVWSIAAPVMGHDGMVCCAIGITGPIFRIPKHIQSYYKDMVVSKARELSRLLGGGNVNK